MNKLKMRKVVGTIIVRRVETDKNRAYFNYEPIDVDHLSIGTKVDLVVEVPIERKLVQSEGAVWKTLSERLVPLISYNLQVLQLLSGEIVASACSTGYRTLQKKIFNGTHKAVAEYQKAAEHVLADGGLHGFGWELEEPAAWDVDWIDFNDVSQTVRITSAHNAMDIYKLRLERFSKVHIYAVGHDGKRCEVLMESEDPDANSD